jgi:outer membrane protein OmpA-like peptidoglycan-associated protein
MALASSALATPALARDGSWYVEVDGGAMIVEDAKFDINNVSNASNFDYNTGYDFGGAVGYDFGAFRLETEASYRRANEGDSYRVGTVTYGSGQYDGGASALSFMVNGLLDFGADDGLQGFVGGGVGVARVKIQASAPTGSSINDTDSGFAWQGLAGIRAPLSDKVDFGLKYRFFNADKVDVINAAGGSVRTRFRSHSLLASLTYNFGSEAAPPPPPPPVEAVCNKGPYIVFFDWDKSDITPEAATILDSAISAYANCDRVPIMLAGYADRSGTVQYNLGLSERRNTSVRSYLGARGIPDGSITGQAFGESNPRVPTADGVRELQNRRVEITYGPGSGL